MKQNLTVLLSQTGTNEPTLKILHNTLGTNIKSKRISTGKYKITYLPTPLKKNKIEIN